MSVSPAQLSVEISSRPQLPTGHRAGPVGAVRGQLGLVTLPRPGDYPLTYTGNTGGTLSGGGEQGGGGGKWEDVCFDQFPSPQVHPSSSSLLVDFIILTSLSNVLCVTLLETLEH